MNDARGTQRLHIDEEDVAWDDYPTFRNTKGLPGKHAKMLVGPGGPVANEEAIVGLVELEPGASYPTHRHEAPEVYYVLRGEARVEIAEQRFTARPGTTMHIPSNTPHGFFGAGADGFCAIVFWWAPGGHSEVLGRDSERLD